MLQAAVATTSPGSARSARADRASPAAAACAAASTATTAAASGKNLLLYCPARVPVRAGLRVHMHLPIPASNAAQACLLDLTIGVWQRANAAGAIGLVT